MEICNYYTQKWILPIIIVAIFLISLLPGLLGLGSPDDMCVISLAITSISILFARKKIKLIIIPFALHVLLLLVVLLFYNQNGIDLLYVVFRFIIAILLMVGVYYLVFKNVIKQFKVTKIILLTAQSIAVLVGLLRSVLYELSLSWIILDPGRLFSISILLIILGIKQGLCCIKCKTPVREESCFCNNCGKQLRMTN